MKSRIYISMFMCLFFLHINISAQTIKVTLLGTGTPQPSIERFGASTLIEAGGNYFLFDCGRGATQRLWQQKIPIGKINTLFLTHLHSDHIVGIPDLWLLGLMPGAFGNRKKPFELYGPAGKTKKYFTGQLVVGEDLMVIGIGESIEVKQNKNKQ
ncbi:MAG: MBL fold metallo-hydrolase [Flavitalea sp.]